MTDTSRSSANRATATARKVFIKTFGCQMNVYDSERMSDILTPHGYQTVAEAGEADLIILNTCHIREKAAEKVYSEIGRLRRFKQERPEETLIAVAGCVAQAEGEEIIRRAGAVDLVFGPQAYHRLPELLEQARTGERVVDTSFPVEDKFAAIPAAQRKTIAARGKTAFLTIQEGCDKFCTFCVVPYTRGAEISRPVRTVVEEAKRLADAGVCEITLLGQNVNAYHGDAATGAPVNLAGLIDILAQVGGIERLRYTTSHPRDMDEDLIAAHRDQPKLMPYVHLPIQSGSDRILAAMNRKHAAADYLEVVEKLRAARPDIAMSGDFIVGFPGESDADFQATLDVVRQVGYAQAYSFKYSPRPGTPASSLGEQLPEQVKAERLAELQQLLNDQQSRFNAGCVGRTMAVLLDRPGRKPGQLAGRSPYLQAVQVDGPEMLAGTIRQVTISRAGSHSLFGTLGRESNGAAAQARPQPAEVGF